LSRHVCFAVIIYNNLFISLSSQPLEKVVPNQPFKKVVPNQPFKKVVPNSALSFTQVLPRFFQKKRVQGFPLKRGPRVPFKEGSNGEPWFPF